MAIAKRGKTYHLRVRLFDGKVNGVKTPAKTKAEAKRIEMALMTACRSGDYRALDPVSREVCVRLFRNQGWEIPPDLADEEPIRDELTVWKACEIFLKYPEIRDCPGRWRHECALIHAIERFGQHRPLRNIWIPQLKRYQVERLNEGAAPDTVNREFSTLSKLFSVMMELQMVDSNPVRLVRRLSTKSSERQVYLSFSDVSRIAGHCPVWFQPVIWSAYYTGMRRGEIFGLTRRQVDIVERMILLDPDDTKEGLWKRVPIHKELVPILRQTLQVASLETGRLFLVQDRKGIRPPSLEGFKNPWPRACEALELERPWPRFHDLRHTWKTNARRSGMDPEIREAIMGHATRQRSVSERYGHISDQELIQAVDSLTFDHGDTQILVVGGRNAKRVYKACTKRPEKKKGHATP